MAKLTRWWERWYALVLAGFTSVDVAIAVLETLRGDLAGAITAGIMAGSCAACFAGIVWVKRRVDGVSHARDLEAENLVLRELLRQATALPGKAPMAMPRIARPPQKPN